MKSILTWSHVRTHGRSRMTFSQITWLRSRLR